MDMHKRGIKAAGVAGVLAAGWCLATPRAAHADRTWTWTGVANSNWMDSHNWDCVGTDCFGTPMYPEDAGADVVIAGTAHGPVIPAHRVGGACGIGTLTLKPGATLTIRSTPDGPPDRRTGLRVWGGGVKLEAGSKILIDGGFLDLRGGGSLDIAAGAKIEFIGRDGRLRFTDDARGLHPEPPEIVVVGDSQMIRDTARELIEGARCTTAAQIKSAGVPKRPVLRIREIDGVFSITAQLINAGEVLIDEEGQNIALTLCGRPKMGSGLWRAGTSGGERATIVVDAVVVGDSCSRLNVQKGKADVNTFWLSAGKIWMQGNPPVEVGVAAGKIMQFGRRHYCGCSNE